jgi:hypothetical protein
MSNQGDVAPKLINTSYEILHIPDADVRYYADQRGHAPVGPLRVTRLAQFETGGTPG